MYLVRPVVLTALVDGLLLAAPLVVHADLVKENASVTYSPSLERWDFSAASASGFINITNITSKSLAKKLMKLKSRGPNHTCVVEYDTDSEIETDLANFYAVYGVFEV